MQNMSHTFDKRLEHRAVGSAALTATAILGQITQRVAQRKAYRTLFNVEAVDVSSGNELYKVVVELSNDGFATVESVPVSMDFGHNSVVQSGVANTAPGDVAEILWSTQQNGKSFKEARLRLIVSGTSPSINLACFSSVLGSV